MVNNEKKGRSGAATPEQPTVMYLTPRDIFPRLECTTLLLKRQALTDREREELYARGIREFEELRRKSLMPVCGPEEFQREWARVCYVGV